MPTGGSMSFPYESERSNHGEKLRPSMSLLVIGADYFRVMGLGSSKDALSAIATAPRRCRWPS